MTALTVLALIGKHKALIVATLGAAYLAAQGQYPEALAALAAALSGGLKSVKSTSNDIDNPTGPNPRPTPWPGPSRN